MPKQPKRERKKPFKVKGLDPDTKKQYNFVQKAETPESALTKAKLDAYKLLSSDTAAYDRLKWTVTE